MRIKAQRKFTYWELLTDTKKLKKSLSRLTKAKCYIDVERLCGNIIRLKLWFATPVTVGYIQNLIQFDKEEELVNWREEW